MSSETKNSVKLNHISRVFWPGLLKNIPFCLACSSEPLFINYF